MREPQVSIRPAHADEGAALTELAVRSKSHWGYSKEFLESARADLTIDAGTIGSSRMYVLEEAAARSVSSA